MSNHEVWKAQIRDCGAVEFVEEHWENHYVRETWERFQRESEARVVQLANSRPLNFDEVFGAPESETSSV